MKITATQLATIAGGSLTAARKANIASILAGLAAMGEQTGMTLPHRLAHYLAQIAHESGRFVYDKEVWGPTPAQKRYDTRTDLGNTAAADGDGKLYAGRTGMQLTGKDNYRQFRDWCWNNGLKAPDFVAEPHRVNEDPWEGLVPLWYWSSRSLNRYADENNIEMVTRKINGGTNGFDDRVDLYVRSALVLLGLRLDEGVVRTFQAANDLTPDDIAGPATRTAMHKALVAMKPDAVLVPVESEIVVPERPVAVPAVPSLPAVAAPAAEPDWQPSLTVPEYLAVIETSTAALRKLTAGA